MSSLAFAPPRLQAAWRWPAVAIGLLLALLLLVYRDTAAGMVEIWSRSETFTHAFLVPPIVGWLIWRGRARLVPITPRPVLWMLLPLALLAVLWWLGKVAAVNSAMHLALAAMLVASVPVVLGWSVTRALAFPLAFLFFAVPIGEFLTPLLMEWTADFVVAAVRATGIPVYREGQQLVIPSGRWAVVEACSGIRYLMASFMVGTLFAYINYTSLKRRLIFVGLSLLVPILANWLRAYIIVMLGHLSDNRIATGVDHLVYGWVFFGIVIMALFFIGARWAEAPAEPTAGDGTAAPAPAGAPRGAGAYLVAALLALLVLQWPAWLQRPGVVDDAARAPLSLALPDALGSWQADDGPGLRWQPLYQGATRMVQRHYTQGPRDVGVVLAYYRGQAQGNKLISSVNVLVDNEEGRWNALSDGLRQAAGTDWQSTLLLGPEVPGGRSRERLRVWRVYWVGGRLTVSDVTAKLQQAWLGLQGQPDDSAAVFLYTVAEEPGSRPGVVDDSPAALAAFADANFGMLQRLLQQARDQR